MKNLAAASAALFGLSGAGIGQESDHSAILGRIKLSDGFGISIFAEMPRARGIGVVEPSGTVFVGSTQDHVYSMVDANGDGIADEVRERATGLNVPNGVAAQDSRLYIALQDKVARALTQVGLAGKTTALPHELSGGEQQRVAIARALVNDPLVLLADEPTGNLDDRATRGVFQLLRDINASGTAVLMATHDLALVRSTSFRTLEMNRGTLVFDSAAERAEPGPASGPTAGQPAGLP
jgi:ABC-type sugar transport system ATPase subunit